MAITSETDAAIRERRPLYPIESVDRALRILLLARDSSSVSVMEASRALEVAPSTAHRLLAMLEHRGFVQRDPRTRRYQAGSVLTDIGLAALKDFDIRTVARPVLEQLVQHVGETAHLTALRGSSVHFLDCVETEKVVRATSRVGGTLPAHATAAGKAQLALLPDETVKDLYPFERLSALTARTIRSRRALLRELAEIRNRGYAENLGESEEHVAAVACAIRNQDGAARGAITVAAPDVRYSTKDFPGVAKILKEATQTLGASLGQAS